MANPMIRKIDMGDSPGDKRDGPKIFRRLKTPRKIAAAIAAIAVIGNQRLFDIPVFRSKTWRLP
jgi:hypothetical protein